MQGYVIAQIKYSKIIRILGNFNGNHILTKASKMIHESEIIRVISLKQP